MEASEETLRGVHTKVDVIMDQLGVMMDIQAELLEQMKEMNQHLIDLTGNGHCDLSDLIQVLNSIDRNTFG
jgi:hypothetical protein